MSKKINPGCCGQKDCQDAYCPGRNEYWPLTQYHAREEIEPPGFMDWLVELTAWPFVLASIAIVLIVIATMAVICTT